MRWKGAKELFGRSVISRDRLDKYEMLNDIVHLLLRVTTLKKKNWNFSQTFLDEHLLNMHISVLRTNHMVLAVKPEFIQSLHLFYSLRTGHLTCMQTLSSLHVPVCQTGANFDITSECIFDPCCCKEKIGQPLLTLFLFLLTSLQRFWKQTKE